MNSKIDFSNYESHRESPGLLFWQVSSLWKRKINEVLIHYDITHTQYVILAVTYFLTPNKEEVTQKKISEFSRIDSMTISNSIRLLEKKSLIIRSDSKIDTRAKIVKLTEDGEVLLKKLLPLVENVDIKFFNILSETEYKNLLKTLNYLLEEKTSGE